MGRGCFTTYSGHGTEGENPTGDPDVDDIVPAPGTERWHITSTCWRQFRIVMSSSSLCQLQLRMTSNQIFPMSQQQEELSSKSIPKGSNTIVVLESTVYPGVTAQTWLPIVEELGLVIGEGFEIAYCPERFQSRRCSTRRSPSRTSDRLFKS